MADNTSLFGGMMSPQEMQQQLIDQRALQFANLGQNQRLAMLGYKAGAGVGQGLGGLFGVDMTDPAIQRATKLRELASQYNTNTASGLRQMAAAIQATDPDTAYKILQQANALEMNEAKLNTERATAIAKLREKQSLDPFQKLLETGKYTPESMAKYQESGDPTDLKLVDKVENKSEFERIVGSLGLDPKQEMALKQQWVAAKLNPDPSGMKAMQVTLAGLQAQALQDKITTAQEKKAEEKKMAIQKLSDTESSLDTSLATAEKALKIAPGSFVGAANQAISANIPWTDAKALNNLVSTLQSEKVMGTLEQLKSQSRTGATGFGAISEKELTLLMNRITSLDPTDKMFKQNLGTVMDEWKRVQQKVKTSRAELQGAPKPAADGDLIERTMKANPGKTREQVIQKLKDLGKI